MSRIILFCPVVGLIIRLLPNGHPDGHLNDQISNLNIKTYDSNNIEIFNFRNVNNRLLNPSDKSGMTPDEISFEVQNNQIVAEWNGGTYYNSDISYIEIIKEVDTYDPLILPEVYFKVIEPDIRTLSATRLGPLTTNNYPTIRINNTLTSENIRLFTVDCQFL